MSTKTLFQRLLAKVIPTSETEFRDLQAAGHKLRKFPGDDSWAKAQRQNVDAIREGKQDGDSGILKIEWCPKCADTGKRLLLLENDGEFWCGSCGWRRPRRGGPDA